MFAFIDSIHYRYVTGFLLHTRHTEEKHTVKLVIVEEKTRETYSDEYRNLLFVTHQNTAWFDLEIELLISFI
jgi:hypothetical protein